MELRRSGFLLILGTIFGSAILDAVVGDVTARVLNAVFADMPRWRGVLAMMDTFFWGVMATLCLWLAREAYHWLDGMKVSAKARAWQKRGLLVFASVILSMIAATIIATGSRSEIPEDVGFRVECGSAHLRAEQEVVLVEAQPYPYTIHDLRDRRAASPETASAPIVACTVTNIGIDDGAGFRIIGYLKTGPNTKADVGKFAVFADAIKPGASNARTFYVASKFAEPVTVYFGIAETGENGKSKRWKIQSNIPAGITLPPAAKAPSYSPRSIQDTPRTTQP